ncbi:MAG: hypothetical protein M1826_000971 [Phylliscum demangeonii]|nr:MAG: hypothetical protein M1826_000971 [Phylliscum demangeonii]
MEAQVNVLVTTFPGLGLPSTLILQASLSSSISDLTTQIHDRLPPLNTRLILTTTANHPLSPSCHDPLSTLFASHHDHLDLLPLRLTVPLCGGKGGFGSQLRAAGGRMSSRRKKNQGENNGSNRNLDGRRLRTVTEAKALAEYLALKPEMEKKEREIRRRRWEQVVELAERREEEVRSGAKAKVNGKWVEDKEEAGERTREAVLAAMKSGHYRDNLRGTSLAASSGSGSGSAAGEGSEDEAMHSHSSAGTTPPPTSNLASAPTRKFAGFDDDDEFMSDDDDEEEEEEGEGEGEDDDEEEGDEEGAEKDADAEEAQGKGKGKATD